MENIEGFKNILELNVLKFFNIYTNGYTISEIILNILFILLILIITAIIYWDTINSKVSKNSRCKRQLDLYENNNGNYVIKATDKTNQPLYNIIYDTKQKNTAIECACNAGTNINNFTNISVKNIRNNKDVKYDKTCSCDKYYNIGIENDNINYIGEPGIVRYMKTGYSDFFDILSYNMY